MKQNTRNVLKKKKLLTHWHDICLTEELDLQRPVICSWLELCEKAHLVVKLTD